MVSVSGPVRSNSADQLIASLVCPPPPSDNVLSEELISNMIVPAPSSRSEYSFHSIVENI